MVFGDADYARLDIAMKPWPMVVPTAKLLKLLELKRLTTDLRPLVLLPVERCISQLEAMRQIRYTRTFRSAMANDMAKFLDCPAAMLQMAEIGHIRQSRAPNGVLVWSQAKKGEEFYRSIEKGLELEFEMDSENRLLLRGDELPLEYEEAASLGITNLELLYLFETAMKLLAEADPDSKMRACAAQDTNGEWQVTLLPQ